MLETAPSDVASRFPRNCRASQPVSKPWKLLKISLPPGGAAVLTCILTCVLHFNFPQISFALAPPVRGGGELVSEQHTHTITHGVAWVLGEPHALIYVHCDVACCCCTGKCID